MVHIAIAGTPEGAKNFISALHALGAEGSPVLEETDFSKYDGLILPGGADIDPELYGEENWGCKKIQRDRDLRQLEITKIFDEAGKPILGVCKGHQLLNIYFGAKMCQHIPEYEMHQWVEADQAHLSRCTPGCFLHEIYGRTEFSINSAHHQAVIIPAEGFIPIQWAPDGILEAMVHDTRPILSLQWHPERMCVEHRRPDAVDGLPVFRYFLNMCQK